MLFFFKDSSTFIKFSLKLIGVAISSVDTQKNPEKICFLPIAGALSLNPSAVSVRNFLRKLIVIFQKSAKVLI